MLARASFFATQPDVVFRDLSSNCRTMALPRAIHKQWCALQLILHSSSFVQAAGSLESKQTTRLRAAPFHPAAGFPGPSFALRAHRMCLKALALVLWTLVVVRGGRVILLLLRVVLLVPVRLLVVRILAVVLVVALLRVCVVAHVRVGEELGRRRRRGRALLLVEARGDVGYNLN